MTSRLVNPLDKTQHLLGVYHMFLLGFSSRIADNLARLLVGLISGGHLLAYPVLAALLLAVLTQGFA